MVIAPEQRIRLFTDRGYGALLNQQNTVGPMHRTHYPGVVWSNSTTPRMFRPSSMSA
jgi:hypothetical protein